MLNTILQIEDDPNDVFLFEHAMRKVGVANPIQVASDGQQAIDYLSGKGRYNDRKQFPLPCLILLDLKLPYVMGLDVLKWIREQTGTPRVVVLLSASGQDSDISAAYRLGANGFLIKPSEASKLQDVARSIKDYWLTHNAPPPELGAQAPMEGTVSLEVSPMDFRQNAPAHASGAATAPVGRISFNTTSPNKGAKPRVGRAGKNADHEKHHSIDL